MITPQIAVEMVLSYHCTDPVKAADLALAALNAAGYAVVNRAQYIESLAELASLTITSPEMAVAYR